MWSFNLTGVIWQLKRGIHLSVWNITGGCKQIWQSQLLNPPLLSLRAPFPDTPFFPHTHTSRDSYACVWTSQGPKLKVKRIMVCTFAALQVCLFGWSPVLQVWSENVIKEQFICNISRVKPAARHKDTLYYRQTWMLAWHTHSRVDSLFKMENLTYKNSESWLYKLTFINLYFIWLPSVSNSKCLDICCLNLRQCDDLTQLDR